MIYIVDIDGTVADLKHRLHFIQQEPADWDSFFKDVEDDRPIFEVITVVRALAKDGHTIVYSTGRPERTRCATRDWLTKYRLPDGSLFMRHDKDHREDNVVKAETLKTILEIIPEVIGGAFEDRQQVVDMYREHGIKVFQVAPRELLMVDFSDPQWRFEERVQRRVDRGCTRAEAEEMVRTVITTKEITHDSGTNSDQHE